MFDRYARLHIFKDGKLLQTVLIDLDVKWKPPEDDGNIGVMTTAVLVKDEIGAH